MTASPVVSIVIVSYNGKAFLEACLASVEREKLKIESESIVVDNGSTDESMRMVAGRFPSTIRIENRTNRGFAAANNQGIAASKGRYVLLLNPDTELHEGAVANVAGFLDAHPDVWVAGCTLRYADGSLQPSVMPFPSVFEGIMKSTFLYLLWPGTAIIGRRNIRVFDYSKPSAVDCVMGAFMMIRREAIEQIGPLDEQFYMYSEEVDFCRRVHDAGHDVWYTPAGTVTHVWSGMSVVSSRGLTWLVASQILYFRKHHHGIECAALIFLKFAGLTIRALTYAAAGAMTRNSTMRAKAHAAATTIWRLVLTSSPEEVWCE